jgi:WS/DGAT/MGAT family acyltransferase
MSEARAHYERLSPVDRTFLDLEDADHPQHVGVTMLFPAAPLRDAAGGIDIERIRKFVAARLHRVPRYRQRLAFTPLERQPVWVDADHFNIEYHVRHSALPRPGSERQLKRMAARVVSQRLDRGKPLWEIWVVEGVEGDRCALITKTHHCMIDGIAGVDLMSVLLSGEPEEPVPPPAEWLPAEEPGIALLARDEILRRAALPWRAGVALVDALRRPQVTFELARERFAALGETFAAALSPASETPLNQSLGPHRRFDWTSFELARVKRVKDRLGGTVNDVILATVAGALGAFLERRGLPRSQQRSRRVRAMVPVSVRSAAERGTTGNQIALWAAALPVAETDPCERLAAVREVTAALKRSKQALGAEVLAAVSEWTVPTLLSMATRMAYRGRAANLVVTNVPGPQQPLYLLGAPLVAAYPMLNLLYEQTLGVALFSYAGRLDWGFMADWQSVPDLHDFVVAVEASFAELCAAAGVE